MEFLIAILVFSLLLFYMGKIIFINNSKNIIKIITLVIINTGLLLYILFKHYVFEKFLLMEFFIQGMVFSINIIYNIFFIKQGNIKKYLFVLIIPIICIILSYANIDNKIALKIELAKSKEKLEKIINNNENYDDVFQDKNIYAFVYFSGVVDNWIAIVYDDSGLLECGIKIINKNKDYISTKEYEKIKMLFGGYLYSIKKIERNWYLCNFT
jgi:hypothetical protein